MSISQAFDAVCVYQDGSDYALNKLRSDPIPHSNNDPDIIYQDEVRAAAGFGYEHCNFANGAKAYEVLKEKFDLTRVPDSSYGLYFVDEQELNGENAATIRVNFGAGYVKATKFTYDESAGNYITSLFTQAMKEEPWVDSATNVSLRFENILILFAKRTAAPGSTEGNVIHELVGSDIGYYACGGEWAAIRWHRESESDPRQDLYGLCAHGQPYCV